MKQIMELSVKNRLHLMFALAALCGLIGCTTKPDEYVMGNGSPADFEQQAAECEMRGEQSRTMYGAGGLAGVAGFYGSYNRVFDACMRSKGFKKRDS